MEGDSGVLLLDLLRKHVKDFTWTCLPTPVRILIASAGRLFPDFRGKSCEP